MAFISTAIVFIVVSTKSVSDMPGLGLPQLGGLVHVLVLARLLVEAVGGALHDRRGGHDGLPTEQPTDDAVAGGPLELEDRVRGGVSLVRPSEVAASGAWLAACDERLLATLAVASMRRARTVGSLRQDLP